MKWYFYSDYLHVLAQCVYLPTGANKFETCSVYTEKRVFAPRLKSHSSMVRAVRLSVLSGWGPAAVHCWMHLGIL